MDDSTERVGLIGLGLMGSALADRLKTAGFRVVGHDLSPEACGRHVAAGGEVVAIEDLDCDRVWISLPDHRVVERAIGGLASKPGRIWIDATTGDPDAGARLAGALAARGETYLDATISGSGEHVRRGEAVLMVGGNEEAFARCSDLLRAVAPRVFHTGPVGSGAKLKLVTNLVLGLNRAALGEGLAFAEALGLDLPTVFEILAASPAHSRIMDTKGPKMLAGDYEPQAKLAQHLKDVGLMLDAGREAGLRLPLTEAHRVILETAVAEGLGDRDNSALFEVLRPRPRRPEA